MNRLLLLCCLLCLNVTNVHSFEGPAPQIYAEVFHEDFSGDLSKWVGKEGDGSIPIKSEIVSDTLRAGGKAIRSKERVLGGDFFTKRAFAPGAYILTFEYLGTCPANCGGVAGFGSDFPGTTQWLAATDVKNSGASTQLIDDQKWHSVSIDFNSKSEFHLIFEHWQVSKGEPGQVMFANIRLLAKPPAPPAALTSEDLGTFLDGIVPAQLQQNDIAGAIISVVKDGQVLFAKGYGYADVAAKKPVSADETLFRVGSISKLFMATAVMQLVEQGKINLDTDINTYLDFRIPDAYGKPITMRHLLTHTAGFEETFKGMMQPDAAHLGSLRNYLATHIPTRIFAPGTVGAYSNYGAALAGYVVEHVSGESFDAYVKRHITDPLGMQRTTFTQPLPAALASGMSNGYLAASDGARPFEFIQNAPAGSMSATATDMTRFMLAHLQGGMFGNATILKPETTALMQSAQYHYDTRTNGACLGFYEESQYGHRIIGHGGDTQFFHSALHLIPDAKTGIFISYNSTGNRFDDLRGTLFDKFMARYFPQPAQPFTAFESKPADAEQLTGWYMVSRRGQDNGLFLGALLTEVNIATRKNGTIVVNGLMPLGATRFLRAVDVAWRETAPGYWEDTGGEHFRLIFKRNPEGRMTFNSGLPAVEYQRAAWYQTAPFLLALLIYSICIFLLVLIIWPIAALIQYSRRKSTSTTPQEISIRRWMRILAAINILIWVPSLFNGPHMLVWLDTIYRATQIAGWLAAAGLIPALWIVYVSWRTQALRWWVKVFRTMVCLACVGMAWILWYGNLLNIQLNY